MEDDKMAASDTKPTKSLGIKQALKRLFRKSSNLSSDDAQWKRVASSDQLAGASKPPEGGVLSGSDGRRHASSSHLDLKQTPKEGNISTGVSTPTTSQLNDMPLEDTAANTAASLKVGKPKLVPKSAFQDNKENIPPFDGDGTTLASAVEQIQLGDAVKSDETRQQEAVMEMDPAVAAERAEHLRFIGEALDMARLALKINETPVGCVLVRNGQIIARGMNATNVTRNGTRHAELMAICALLSCPPKDSQPTTRLKPKELSEKEAQDRKEEQEAIIEDGESFVTMSDASSFNSISLHEGNEDGSKGHLYPYGQKLLPEYRVDKSIITESILYVTVEPCIMCASLLKQLGIKKVYFGAVNDKFGGTGGVFSIHANSLPVSEDGQTASAHPMPRATQLPDGGGGHLGVSFPPGGGDGGNVERGYEIEGGWGRDEAVGLLRRFYVQENGRAPVPRKKEGRAARLAAIENGELGIDTGDEDRTGDATPNMDSEKEDSGETDI